MVSALAYVKNKDDSTAVHIHSSIPMAVVWCLSPTLQYWVVRLESATDHTIHHFVGGYRKLEKQKRHITSTLGCISKVPGHVPERS